MNFNRIHYFLTLCESMNFTDAARSLQISQPALTKAIKQLEFELGLTLIRREGKRTHLTRPGKEARLKYRELMILASKIETEVNCIASTTPKKICIAVTYNINFRKIAKFLKYFRESHPGIQVDIKDCCLQDAENLLALDDVDCIFTADKTAPNADHHCIELYRDRIGVLCLNGTAPAHTYAYLTAQLDEESTPTPLQSTPIIFAQNQNGYRGVVKCRQQLWLQDLVRAGVGSTTAFQGSSTIEGLGVNVHEDAETLFTTMAILPCQEHSNAESTLLATELKLFFADESGV